MNVMVSLPDEFAARFGPEPGRDRQVLEVLAVSEFRAGRLSRAELREVLGLRPGALLDSVLQKHGVQYRTTGEDLEHDMREIRGRLRSEDTAEREAAAADLVEHFRAFRADKSLAGLDVHELIREGRR